MEKEISLKKKDDVGILNVSFDLLVMVPMYIWIDFTIFRYFKI